MREHVLSPAQRRMWLLGELAAPLPLMSLPHALRLCGPLDVAALHGAILEVQRRHGALRVQWVRRGDGVAQAVADTPLALVHTDLGDVPAARRWHRALALLRTRAAVPFTAGDRLWRAELLRLAADDHVLFFNAHHAVFDLASLAVVLATLRATYDAMAAGAPMPVAPEDRAWLAEPNGPPNAATLRYWAERLQPVPEPLPLPADRDAARTPSYEGAVRARTLPVELTSAVNASAQAARSTPAMVLLAAYQVLLARYADRDDIVVGVPFSTRTSAALQGAVGVFVNTLAVRADLAGAPTFAAVVTRVRDAVTGAFAHHDLPFERLLEALPSGPRRPGTASSLLPVLFDCAYEPMPALELRGLAPATPLPVWELHNGTAKADLLLRLERRGEALVAVAEFATARFEPATIERLLGHFEQLLSAAVAAPDRPIHTLGLLTPAERAELETWNATAAPYPDDRTLHGWIAEVAARRPDAVAVECGDQRLRYADLVAAATHLAQELWAAGVAPGDRVALCTERGIERIIGIVGILAAGAAYVAVAEDGPPPRWRRAIEDANARCAVTTATLQPRVAPLVDRCIVASPLPDAPDGDTGIAPAWRQGDAAAVAYVAYTSGSTGRPQGVAVTHRNVMSLLLGTDYVDLGPDEILLHAAPLEFDASTFEIFGALLHGGRLVVMPPGALDLQVLGDMIAERRVSTAWLTASVFHWMIDRHAASLRGLRQLLAGGEALSRPHVQRALQLLPNTRLINGYGPTETTTFACCATLRDDGDLARTVPIGRPITNRRAHVLDRHGQPVPVGVAGELYLAGDGVAVGYLARPAATAAAFVAAPAALPAEARAYRTRDRVRRLPDGRLEFLDRFDRQVKLRGHRVEPGEIEAVLRRHRAVRAGAVAVRGDGADRELVAYVVPRPGTPAASLAATLRTALAADLPAALIPTAFVPLDALPRTPSGKLNRSALPSPSDEHRRAADGDAPPTGGLEREIAAAFCASLGVDRVGRHDHFFELGGHSLALARAWGILEAERPGQLPLVAMFEHPTVATLAAFLGAGDDGAASTPHDVPPPPTEDRRARVAALRQRARDAQTEAQAPRHLPPSSRQ